MPALTSGASAPVHFVFESIVNRTTEATANPKQSKELLGEFLGLEEYDLTVGVYKTR